MANKRAAELQRALPGGSRSASPAPSRPEPSNNPGNKAPSPQEQNKAQIDFQFLNFSHPSDAKASRARRAVRSHVTRQQHQREHAAQAARRSKSFQPQGSEPEELPPQREHSKTLPSDRPVTSTLQPDLTTTESTSSPEASSGSTSPTMTPNTHLEGRVNPAELYPEGWHPYIPQVMDHYLSNMAVDIPNLDEGQTKERLRTQFFPFIMTDPAPLHAAMLIAASHYGKVHGPHSHAIDLLQLRGMAIREINRALEDKVRATSDQLVAAVAQMACYEALYGDRNIFNTHMTGLLRMVTLRGGLDRLGLDGLLEHILLWIDSNAAHITGSRIYFDLAAFPASARHPQPDPGRFAGGLTRT